MRLDMNIDTILKILVPLLIISVVVFFIYKSTTKVENFQNIDALIKSAQEATHMAERSAKLMERTANDMKNDSCGPKYAPPGENYRLNAGQPGTPGPSCNNNQPQYAPPYQQPAPYPPHPPHPNHPYPNPQAPPPPNPPAAAPTPPQKREKPPPPPEKRYPIPQGKTAEIKMIWAQWCGFSRKAAPEFNKLREQFANTKHNDYTLVFNDHEEGHSDFRDLVRKYEIKGFPTYVVIVKDNDKELHVGKFNSIKMEDMEMKLKKEIDSVNA